MNSERMAVGIGLILAILAAFTVPAMAGPNTMYFTNYSGDTSLDGISYVELWLNVTDVTGVNPMYGFMSADIAILLDEDVGIVEGGSPIPGHPWDSECNCNMGLFDNGWWITIEHFCSPPPPIGMEPGVYPVMNLSIEGNNTGVTDLYFRHVLPYKSNMFDSNGADYPNQTWVDGTYTCTGPTETFEKELVAGWNLISLPLTASDMTVAYVFASVSSNYSAIYRYDAETKHFVVLSGTDVAEYGVGYFIYMTSADTWTYEGMAYGNMNVGLSQGLNMVGWLNCTKDISDALSSIAGKYRYAARWNSTMDKYEVYVPGASSGLNDFNTMEQGRGYFISMKEGATLSGNR